MFMLICPWCLPVKNIRLKVIIWCWTQKNYSLKTSEKMQWDDFFLLPHKSILDPDIKQV